LISCDPDKGVRILDTATGKELRRIERPGEPIRCFALSPDSKAIITGSWSSPLLRQWDVSTGKELRQIPTGEKDTSVVAFAPNGKTLAAVMGQTVIRLWDVATWKETYQLRGHSRWIGSLAFSPDGKTLLSGGGIANAMRWWDVGTGREIRRLGIKSEHFWEPTLSPDGTRLAALLFPGAVLYLWDATTGGEITRTALGEEGGWSCLCFSPDSEALACGAGTGRRGNQTLFFAAATGRELRRWNEVSYTSRMAFSPNGKILAQAQGGVIRLRDAATGKPLLRTPLPDYVMSVRFTPDERTLLASCWGGQTGAWQPFSGELRRALNGPPEGFAGRADMLLGTALSNDGERAALVDARGVLHVWDPATGKVWCRISEPRVGEDQADFSPDGNVLVVKHVDNVIRVWDTMTGKMRCSLPRFGATRFPHPHAVSADGRVVATAPSSQDKNLIRLWDGGTGQELGKLAWEDMTSPTCLAFSPAGKYLVAAHNGEGLEPRGRSDGIILRLWDLATGRALRRFRTPPGEIRALAISPDGKTLAAGANDTVLLWELASGEARGRFPGHREWVWSLAFSPSGRLLASGSLDHTALVWDVTGICPDGRLLSRTPQPDEIERLWTGLDSSDGVRAYRAMWMMVAAARPSVSFLAERLQPKQPVADARLERLIAELDSEEFKNRARASQELEELGELAETALRKALASTRSLEVRRRVDSLLHKVEAQTLSPEQLLTLRALEVLEHIGTPEAKQVLQNLAKGAPGARLTQEAKASLERLSRRP
jgi:WD40 repeat protein